MLGRPDTDETPSELYRRLRLQTLQAERDEVLKIRSSGTIDHDVVEQVLASYDIEESTLTIATQRADQLTEEQPVETPATPAGLCAHLERAPADIEPAGSRICQDCVREGTRTVHLRICLTCGNVGCCNSSVGSSRRAARPHELPPGDPELRAGRVMALVLRRRAPGLIVPGTIERRIRTGRPALFSGTHDVGGAA